MVKKMTFTEEVQGLKRDLLATSNASEDLKDVTDLLITEVNLKHRIAARRERTAVRLALKEAVQRRLASGEAILTSLGEAAKELSP